VARLARTARYPPAAANPASGSGQKKSGDDGSIFAMLSLLAGGAWGGALLTLGRFGTAILSR